ncbi:GTPase IMAP family member 8-like [Sinocyclocheilus grahami]|uniref:GTPase IMAP family member 8-like n=1 Tax=Sinocyclocheilus grahami TaxID=75366 RepID=UPI0007AD3365|nr:PREDICTED: GTPase IMAP family member 8-like [Sinocyclocheilus grahami]
MESGSVRSSLSVAQAITSRSSSYVGHAGWEDSSASTPSATSPRRSRVLSSRVQTLAPFPSRKGTNMNTVSNLRIVLLGKNESENSRLGNIILDTTAFSSDAPSYLQQHSVRISGEVEKRHITVINTHLLQPNLSEDQIIEAVRECVSLSAPGPHVFVLVMQYNDFTENDRNRVKYVLNLFSEQAMKHTIVLTTDEETRGFIFRYRNIAIHDLIKECEGRHLQFDTSNPGWPSELFRKTEEILKKEREDFLIGNMYEDGGDGSSVDEDLSRSGASVRDDNEEEDPDLKECTKTGRGGGVTVKAEIKAYG